MAGVFGFALAKMAEKREETFNPISFQKYVSIYDLGSIKTAPSISIDHIERLPRDLREGHTMVLRLGSPSGENNTHFGLVRCKSGWDDYFLLDPKLFGSTRPELFLPQCSYRDLYAFELLPTLTESSFVNLAIASGLLHSFLNLDADHISMVPATGQSVFSFEVKPRHDLDIVWQHQK